MARAAGGGRNYTIGVVDTKGKLVEELEGFPSVTTVIGRCDASKVNALMGWAYNLTVTGMKQLNDEGKLKPGMSEPAIKQRLKTAKLTPWSKRDDAATRGTGVHEWAEKLLQGQATYDEVLEGTVREQQGYARALIEWHQQYKRTPQGIERTLVHLGREYAGTVDLVDSSDAEGVTDVAVCDFKTSKAIYDSQFTQGEAYAQAWEDMCARRGNPVRVSRIEVIRFGADGKFEVGSRPYEGAAVFNAMRELYAALEGGSK